MAAATGEADGRKSAATRANGPRTGRRGACWEARAPTGDAGAPLPPCPCLAGPGHLSPAPCAEIGHTPDVPQAALARSSKVNGQDPGPDPGGHRASGIVARPAYRARQGPAGGRMPVAAGPAGAARAPLTRSPESHRGGAVRLPAGE